MTFADELRQSIKTDEDRLKETLKRDIDWAVKQFRNECFNASVNYGKTECISCARIYDSSSPCLFFDKKPEIPREFSSYGAIYCDYQYCILMAEGIKEDLSKDGYKKLIVEIRKVYANPDAIIFKGKLSYKIYLYAAW